MALRNIVKEGDPVLRKVSREVTDVNDRIRALIDDLTETMRNAEGVGLAAPQVGVLRRVTVIDIGEGLHEFVNPEIIEERDYHEVVEGCLSCPDEFGLINRPSYVKARAFDRFGNQFEIEGEDFFAQAMSHEFDHLDGVIFKSKVNRMLTKEELEEMHRQEESEEE